MLELEAAINDLANQSGSGAWARAQTDEALQGHLDWTEPGSQSYEAAARELSRREAVQSQQLQLPWIKMAFWATIVLGVLAIAATLIA